MTMGRNRQRVTARYAGGSGSAPVLTSNKVVLFVGDSTTAGVGAGNGTGLKPEITNARPFSFPIQARDRLVALGINAISDTWNADNNNGILAAELNQYRPEITLTGNTLATYSQGPTAGGIIARINVGAIFNFTTAVACDTIKMWHPRNASLGVAGFQVDGGAVTNISQTGADGIMQTTLTFALGVHTFNFTRVSGIPTLPNAMTAYNSTMPSVQIMNAGARVWTSGRNIAVTNVDLYWNNNSAFTKALPSIGSVAADVLVICIGINNVRQAGYDVNTMISDIQTIANTAIAANAACKIILVLPTMISSYVSWTAAQMLSAYQGLITSNPTWAFVDTGQVLAAAAGVNPATWAGLDANGYAYDPLHLKGNAYAILGVAVGDAIKTALGL